MTLREQLQDALGAAYTIQRELGGGGMSRVFVARDETLGREVVVKVLPPELLAGVSVDRFDREVRLAARLQHAHIVPVLSAGQMNGVPYYTMPFVEGASLRDRLIAGPLPVSEAVSTLRDVARALAYAHERGIVHRDIKPDNVLVAGGSAVVTDFGIAKAITAARTGAPGETLTQIGVSIGTPAYMAPEQAAADPDTDHRADLYSFGCLAYELLTGRPPFTAKSPQRLLAAHLSEAPEPIAALRPDVPPPLAQLLMKCLAKDADERPQRAADIVRVLETVTSGAGYDAMPMILATGRGMLKRALLLYTLAFIVVAVVARAAIIAVGLPDWVFPGALVVMALGLPVILFTAYVHRTARTLIGSTPTYTPGGTPSLGQGTMQQLALKASPHVSWRRAALGGALAVTTFVLLVGAYMVLRALGIGPAGSLLASGAIAEHEKILVADLQSPVSDSTLGPVVTDAFRTALGQSQSVTVLQAANVRDVLRRMERPADTPIDFPLAREIATREGVKAVIDGSLLGVGGRYVIALRLVSAQTGEPLATFRETADDQSEILPAVDDLAKRVRAKIGESLRDVQSAPPLEQVTTRSLEALTRYVQGSRAFDDGDFPKGASLLQEAVALDSGFAMAYRKLAIEYGNRGLRERAGEYYEKAYANIDRLSDAERYLLLGTYYQLGKRQDAAKSAAAYERLLEIQPNNTAGLNNLAVYMLFIHQYARAESLVARAIRAGPVAVPFFRNKARAQAAQGRLDAALATADDCAKAVPRNDECQVFRISVLWALGRYDSVAALIPQLERGVRDATGRSLVLQWRSELARLHGKLREASQYTTEAWQQFQQAGRDGAALSKEVTLALDQAWFLGDRVGAVRRLDEALARTPLGSVGAADAPYVPAVKAYAMAGRADRARGVMAEWNVRRRTSPTLNDSIFQHAMAGSIALAEREYLVAQRELRAAGQQGCEKCNLPPLGQAYDLGGSPDSAIAVYERFVTHRFLDRLDIDALFVPATHKRLAELYEARGERDKAVKHNRAFIELWKDADPELQPSVTAARQRVAELTRGTDVAREGRR